ncbi:hypothetical protein [Streptomyces sp. NPDC093093]|uniref:hypothetical protein n=1 Tax=Streptomyces sp. NPDC093093 TaxID=3366025 RepID=UPI0037FB22D3
MRARTTAAAFLGALALVLPASGQAMADDDHDDRHTLGRLYYVVEDEDGDEYTRHISPADNDTCYELTGTSRHQPATEAYNRTESLAVLFEGRGCNGRAVRTLAPGDGAHDVEALSVYFRPTGGNGHHGHDGDWNDDDRSVRRDARPEQGGLTHLAKPTVAAVAAHAAAPAARPGDDEPSADEQWREDEQRGEDEEGRDEAGRPGDDQAEDENGQRDEDEARDERGQDDENEARDQDEQRDDRGQDGEEEEEYGVLDAVFRTLG